jgi:hypothetical protein
MPAAGSAPIRKNPLNKGPGAAARQPGSRLGSRLWQLAVEPDAADPHRLAQDEIGEDARRKQSSMSYQ